MYVCRDAAQLVQFSLVYRDNVNGLKLNAKYDISVQPPTIAVIRGTIREILLWLTTIKRCINII